MDANNQNQLLDQHISGDHLALLTALNKTALVSVTDKVGNILYVNDLFLEVSGYSNAELLGQNHRIVKSPQTSMSVFEELWQTISSSKIWRGELQNRNKQGESYWLDMSIVPVLSVEGDILRYVTVGFETTQRKSLELNLVEQNQQLVTAKEEALQSLQLANQEKSKVLNLAKELEKFQLAVKNASDHIVITDNQGIILYANDAVEKITGFSRKEILGKKAGAKELWGGLMDEIFYQELWRCVKIDKKPFSGRIKNKRKNGEEYFAFTSITPVFNHDQVEFFVSIERDITHEVQVDKMKTEFISLASHQLRTPLTGLKWNLEMLLDGDLGEIPEAQKQVLKTIYQSGQRLVDLVNSLLDISKIEIGQLVVEKTETDVKAVITDLVTELTPLIVDKKHHLEIQLAPQLGNIYTDSKLLRNVLLNLLSNAIKYTPSEGKLGIDVTLVDSCCQFRIWDTGLGIPDNEQSKMFDKFYRGSNVVKNQVSGTGLGMYLVKSIIESLHGKLWFESKENQGTSFWFTLPISS